MSKVAVCVPNGHVTKWYQLLMYSLKKHKNDVDFDIFVGNTWPEHPSRRVVEETDLADNVTFIDCKMRKHSHATALDEILDVIQDDPQYKYMMAVETDAMACRDGWLDWFVSQMKDDSIAMAGFFWHEGNMHYNINPSGTLYNINIIKKYHQEARDNDEGIFYHPKGNKIDTDGGMDPSIKNVVGAFAETRGIKNPTQVQVDVMLKGCSPHVSWWEPGAWLYCKTVGEYGAVAVHCDHIYTSYAGHKAPEGTYYGGKVNPQYIHFWGGTRCYDFLKHPVNDNFVKSCAPLWIKREDTIWKQNVPERYRKKVHEVNKNIDLENKMRENLGIWVPEAL